MRRAAALVLLLASCGGGEMGDAEFQKLVHEGHQYLSDRLEENQKNFQLGSWPRWDWNQDKGEIVFSDKGVPKVVARIQFVGSVSKNSNTWLWSWDNPTISGNVKDRMGEVREFGRKNRISKLTTAKWSATESDGWDMMGITAKVLKAKGAYRTPDDDGFTFMVFTDIGWAPSK